MSAELSANTDTGGRSCWWFTVHLTQAVCGRHCGRLPGRPGHGLAAAAARSQPGAHSRHPDNIGLYATCPTSMLTPKHPTIPAKHSLVVQPSPAQRERVHCPIGCLIGEARNPAAQHHDQPGAGVHQAGAGAVHPARSAVARCHE